MKQAKKSLKVLKESTLNTSRPLLPQTPLSKNEKIRSRTQQSMNQSVLSVKSDSLKSPRLANSFYNDHSYIYQSKSRQLLEKNRSFQSRPISLSQRKRYESNKVEQVAVKYQKLRSLENLKSGEQKINGIEIKRDAALRRFHDIMSSKHKRLVNGDMHVKVNKDLLQKNIKRSLSQKSNRKWKSPFLGGSERDKFRGEQLLPRKIQKMYGNQDPTQLKVLNLDRLFRVNNGQLSNVVPLPVAKLSQISAKSNIVKTVLHKDKIHDVIRQYNGLLRLMKLKQTVPRLGVKGKHFLNSPTIQELMGIKLNPSKGPIYPTQQLLSEEIFVSNCPFYLKYLKKDVQLTKRLISGISEGQIKGISLAAYARFYTLFVNNVASEEDKANFLAYFFVPAGESRIQFDVLKLILELMCAQLPSIQRLNFKTDLLSRQQKSNIFLEALNRVLFGQMKDDLQEKGLNREILRAIFRNNPDATDLIIRLVQIQ